MPSPHPKVLIVDDHAGVRSMIKRIVANATSSQIEAADGEESLKLYRLHQPDLVLMDVAMPGMDGLQATRLLRSEFPAARVVIVTQHDNDASREAARSVGASGYVLKDNLLGILDFIGATHPQARP